jgi:two-component system OmpR family sensor kinase
MSLRTRVLIGMGLLALVLIGVGVIVTRSTGSYLLDRLDAQLESAALPNRPMPDRPNLAPNNDDTRPLNQFYIGVVRNGTLQTLLWPGFPDTTAPIPDLAAESAAQAARDHPGEPFTVGATTGSERFRVVAEPGQFGDEVHVVALSLSDVDAATNRLVVLVAIGIALALAVLALVTWWVIRLGVRPIKKMTATATAIAEGDLSHRVDPAPAGTEAGELGTALNTMLGRIEESFAVREASEERLRQFVADASHELRTPVTSIRGYAELYQRGALDDEASLAQAMRRTEQEAIRMGRLIDDLLLLARLDQGRPLERATVDLGHLVNDAVLDARAIDPERPITTELASGVNVLGDEHRLHQVVANVIANSLRHSPQSAAVHVQLTRTDRRAVLEVSDEGPGMTPDVAARAFERFYRADPSRSRDRGGSGLGLSIVRAIVEAHGGSVTLVTAVGEGTTVRIELPLHGGLVRAEAPAPTGVALPR